MQNMFSGSKAMGDLFSTLAIYAVIIGGMYFFLFRPQQKKRKQEDEINEYILSISLMGNFFDFSL